MTINWYPGHMKRARRQIAEVLPTIDVVVEILDARLPVSSRNMMLQDMLLDKPCVKILNKNDLSDPAVTKDWVRNFEQIDKVRAMPLNAKQRLEVRVIPKLCRTLSRKRSKPSRSLNAMVVGIPNVGKSTLINSLAGKRIARVGNKPAITTCPQMINLRNGIFLYDTPGLLWPAMDDQNAANKLAASGAIGQNAMDVVSVALFAAEFMGKNYPEHIFSRYKLDSMPKDAFAILEAIGRRRGFLISGGKIDLQRTAEVFLHELRNGKLGRISFERSGEYETDIHIPDT